MRFTDDNRVRRPPAEGRDADPTAIAHLKLLVEIVDGEQRAQLIRWAKEADAAHAPFRPSQQPTLRRFELSRAAWRAVTSSLLPDDTMRAALVVILGDDAVQPAWPTGAILGSCNADEAARLAHLLDQWASPDPQPQWEEA